MKRTRLPGDDGATSSPAVPTAPVGVSADGLRQRLMPMGLTVGDATVLIPGIDPTWPVPRDDGAVGDPVTHQVLPAYANQGDHGPGWAFWKYKRVDTLTNNRQYPFLQLLAGAYKHRSVERLVDPVSLDNAKREDTQLQAALDAERKRIVVPADEKARQIAKMREQQQEVASTLRVLDTLYQDARLFSELGAYLLATPTGGLAMLMYQREQYRVLYEILERSVAKNDLDASVIKAVIAQWFFNPSEDKLFPDPCVATVRAQWDGELQRDPLSTTEQRRWWIMRLGFYMFLRDDICAGARHMAREAMGVVKQSLVLARYLVQNHTRIWEALTPVAGVGNAGPRAVVADGITAPWLGNDDPRLSSTQEDALKDWFAQPILVDTQRRVTTVTDHADIRVYREASKEWVPPTLAWDADVTNTLRYWNRLLGEQDVEWPSGTLHPGALRYWFAAASYTGTISTDWEPDDQNSVYDSVSACITSAYLQQWIKNAFIGPASQRAIVAAFLAMGNDSYVKTASVRIAWIDRGLRSIRISCAASVITGIVGVAGAFQTYLAQVMPAKDVAAYLNAATGRYDFDFAVTDAGAATDHWRWISGELDQDPDDVKRTFTLRDLFQSWVLHEIPPAKYVDVFFTASLGPMPSQTKLDKTWLAVHRMPESYPNPHWFSDFVHYTPHGSGRLVRMAATASLVLAGEYLAVVSAFLRQRAGKSDENTWLAPYLALPPDNFYVPIVQAANPYRLLRWLGDVGKRAPLVFQLLAAQVDAPVQVKNAFASLYVTLPWDQQEHVLRAANPGLERVMEAAPWLFSGVESLAVLVRALEADRTIDGQRARLQSQTEAMERARDEYERIVSGLQSELTDEKALLRRLYQGPRAWHLRPEITGRIELSADVVYALERALSLVHGKVPGMAWCTLDDLTDKAHIASGLPGAFADLVAALDTQSSLGHPHQWNSQMQHNAAPGQRLDALNAVCEYTYDQRTRRITRRQGRSTAAYGSGGALYYIM